MRFIGVIGTIIAVLGLIGGPIAYLNSQTIFAQILSATGTMTGMLGLIAAALGVGLADIRDAIAEHHARLETIIAKEAMAKLRLRTSDKAA